MDPVSNTQSPPGAIDIGKILSEQNFNLAIPAGIGAAILGAVVWAVVTVATEMQLGLMAIAVGYIVGRAVRAVGHGIEPKFGYLGAACALLGCIAGNVLSDIAFYAKIRGIGFGEALGDLDMALLTKLVSTFSQPMDLLFYAIAIYEGYKFSLKYRLVKPAPAAQ
jgi:hypothetical protein